MSVKVGTAASGFTLVESLVAMTLLSASLAVAASTLVQTLQHQRRAAEHSAALRLVTSFAEDLRGLRRPDGRALRALDTGAAAGPCPDTPVECVAEEQAAASLMAWLEAVAVTLPEGSVATVRAPDPGIPAYDIRVEWPDTTSQATAAIELRVMP